MRILFLFLSYFECEVSMRTGTGPICVISSTLISLSLILLRSVQGHPKTRISVIKRDLKGAAAKCSVVFQCQFSSLRWDETFAWHRTVSFSKNGLHLDAKELTSWENLGFKHQVLFFLGRRKWHPACTSAVSFPDAIVNCDLSILTKYQSTRQRNWESVFKRPSKCTLLCSLLPYRQGHWDPETQSEVPHDITVSDRDLGPSACSCIWGLRSRWG